MLRKPSSVVAATGVLCACVLVFAASHRSGATSVSDEALMSTFESDLRHVVVRWAPEDQRPRAERQRALFDFVYQTYESSAWIPQSLFDRNLVMQAVVGSVDTIVRDQVGLVLWRDNRLVPAFGMAPNRTVPGARTEPLRWTVNCLVCHTAEIDGVPYFGAGTKTFDDKCLGEALKLLTDDRLLPFASRRSIDHQYAGDAHRILNSHHHDKIDSLTRARSTAFAASHVELYMRPNGGRMPAVEDVGRGDTKTPPLWHTAAKMPGARWYSDGSFHGAVPLMASSMELEKDRSFDALVTSVIPRIKQEFDAVIRHLRPPRYPYAIDPSLAERGRQLFYSKSVGCSRCHGVYDGKGNVEWPGVHTDVGTDLSRRDIVSAGFIDAFRNSPIAKEGELIRSRGYAATPLTGVWANYPYLHNGSVPTLHHLLGPESERPRIFHVLAARKFDPERVGQMLHAKSADDRLSEAELMRRSGDDRDWFNVTRPGSGNEGHDMWGRIRTDANRKALIEYLKTL